MPRLLFTDLAIQKLKWNGRATVYWSEALPAFGCRVMMHRKTWVTIQGKKRKVTTIGHYPDRSLKEATKRARLALLTPEDSSGSKTYSDALEEYLEVIRKTLKPATVSQYKSYLETFGFQKKLSEITKEDIQEKLKLWEGKKWGQNYAYVSLRCLLNWSLDQLYIDKHPLIRGNAPNKTRSRDRVLSDEELGRVWRCTTDDTYGRILRLILLTGQRPMEVKNLKPDDVADGLITFHTKGDKINVLPVTPMVRDNLSLPFTFNNWGNAKARFDNDCGVDFQQRDLRRTLATKCAAMGTEPTVIERILGHAQVGVQWTYNRYQYLEEVRAALLRYHAHIKSLA